MRLLTKRLFAALRSYAAAAHHGRRSSSKSTLCIKSQPLGGSLLEKPWSTTQFRGARFSGVDNLRPSTALSSRNYDGDRAKMKVRAGNIIERRGKIYEVVKAHHTTQGRGGAIMQVELRDVDSGNKVNERLRTDEPVEKIYVQQKLLEYLYTDDGGTGNVVLMESKTYDQLEVPPHLFGESRKFLQDDMEVTVQLYDDKLLSASIPTKITCTIVEAAEARQGSGTPHYKRALLDNGVTVQVPGHIEAGDKIIVNTAEGSYVSRV